MKSKSYGIIFIIASIILIIGVGAFVLLQNNAFEVSKGSKSFQCQVKLDGDALSETDIVGEPICSYTGECGFFAKNFVFGLFEDKGTIVFRGSDGEIYAMEPYEVSEIPGRTKTFILKGCTNVEQGTIIVTSETYDSLMDKVQFLPAGSLIINLFQDAEQDRAEVSLI